MTWDDAGQSKLMCHTQHGRGSHTSAHGLTKLCLHGHGACRMLLDDCMNTPSSVYVAHYTWIVIVPVTSCLMVASYLSSKLHHERALPASGIVGCGLYKKISRLG